MLPDQIATLTQKAFVRRTTKLHTQRKGFKNSLRFNIHKIVNNGRHSTIEITIFKNNFLKSDTTKTSETKRSRDGSTMLVLHGFTMLVPNGSTVLVLYGFTILVSYGLTKLVHNKKMAVTRRPPKLIL